MTEPQTERDKLRSFTVMTSGIFTVLGLLPALFRHHPARLWILVVAGLLLAMGLFCPQRLRLVYQIGWPWVMRWGGSIRESSWE